LFDDSDEFEAMPKTKKSRKSLSQDSEEVTKPAKNRKPTQAAKKRAKSKDVEAKRESEALSPPLV
jgi:hypothetical protein